MVALRAQRESHFRISTTSLCGFPPWPRSMPTTALHRARLYDGNGVLPRSKTQKGINMTIMATSASPALNFLEDRWDAQLAATLDEPELLRYRSNLLGSDLRLTNFAGGNTSSKIMETDPLTGEPVEVLWVKGSGGDLGSIKRTGFATLYQQKLLALETRYKAWSTKTKWWRSTRSAPSAATRWPLPSTRRCTAFFPSRTWTICIPTGPSRWPPRPTAKPRWRSSTANSATPWCGFPGSARALSWD